VARNTAKNPNGRRKTPRDGSGKGVRRGSGSKSAGSTSPTVHDANDGEQPRKNGGWREIEARREKAALRASLADVWDEDFDLDDEILAELDHTAEFFTSQEEPEEEIFEGEDEEVDEYFEDEEV